MTRFTVAIDGPAAAGKGTVARMVAARFGFAHMDTGLLYRAVARRLIDAGTAAGEAAAAEIARDFRLEDLEREDLRTRDVSLEASRIAAMPDVRRALLRTQTDFARREGGAVLDGRDIGTVIAPDAHVKLFVTASEKVRAERRFRELSAAGGTATLEEVQADLAMRDRRDGERGLSAMKPACDALLLDTSELTIEQVADAAIAAVNNRLE